MTRSVSARLLVRFPMSDATWVWRDGFILAGTFCPMYKEELVVSPSATDTAAAEQLGDGSFSHCFVSEYYLALRIAHAFGWRRLNGTSKVVSLGCAPAGWCPRYAQQDQDLLDKWRIFHRSQAPSPQMRRACRGCIALVN